MGPLIVGLAGVVLCQSFGYATGISLNPARDMGARIACHALGYRKGLWERHYWSYGITVGPIVGASIGAFL